MSGEGVFRGLGVWLACAAACCVLLRGDPCAGQGVEEARGALDGARALAEGGELDEALARYEALAEAHEGQGWLLREIGQSLMDAGRFAEASPWLDRAIKVDGLDVEAVLKAALCRDALGMSGEAARLYGRALLLEPGHARAAFNLGRLQIEAGELEKAEATYRDLIARHPNHWMGLNNLGLLLVDRGQPTAALGPLRRARALQPGDPGVMHNLGRAHAGRREAALALGWFDRALAALGAEDLSAVRLHFDRGGALFALGRFEEACAAYRSALSLDPGYAPARLNLGAALANLGRDAEAVEALEQAVAYSAERIAILHQIAVNHMARQDPDGALIALERARRLDEGNARTWTLLAQAMEARGDAAGAEVAQRRACHLGVSAACP